MDRPTAPRTWCARISAPIPRVSSSPSPMAARPPRSIAGCKQARGEVVVALDADTHFQKDAISRLVRWFEDPAVGAVAGNAKVGNRINVITRWQALEYVTSQNLERRALAALGCITVVPGAIGAWRREALERLGGFPVDTLAEDQDLTIALPEGRLHRALRQHGDRVDRGAGHDQGARQAALPLGLRHVAMPVEAPRGDAPAALRRPGPDRHAADLAVPIPAFARWRRSWISR